MDERIRVRLDQLRAEARTGEQRLVELRSEEARVHDTLHRINGAILALEGLLSGAGLHDESEVRDGKVTAPR
jgi:hypothetical protein